MAFKAYERFREAIDNSFANDSCWCSEFIVGNDEIKKILAVQENSSSGFTYDYIAKMSDYRLSGQSLYKFNYSNGISLIDSSMYYIDEEGNHNSLRQIFVTSEKSNKPILNLIMKEKKVALLQILCGSTKYGTHVKEDDKNILVQEVTFDVGLDYTCSFTSFSDISKNRLLMEKYRRNYIYPFDDLRNKDLSLLLGSSSKELEFLYKKGRVDYVQIASNERVPTNDAKNLVEREIQKFSNITYEIISKRQQRSVKKRVKKY